MPFASASLPPGCPSSRSHASGHGIEPWPKRPVDSNDACLANQCQEYGLHCIVNIMRVEQHLPAHVAYHRSVAQEQRLECQLIVTFDKSLEHLPVRHPRERAVAEQPGSLHRSTCSQSISHRRRSLLGSPYVIYARSDDFNLFFWFSRYPAHSA